MTSQGASPYLMDDPPTSPGRAFLARAFAHWCALDHGISEVEIAAALAGDPGVPPNVARRIANATRLVGEVLAMGRMRSWARPKGGGVPEPMDASLWELDDYRARLATSGVSLATPFDPDAEPSHYVFVDIEDFNAIIETAFGDFLPTPPRKRTTRAGSPRAAGDDAGKQATGDGAVASEGSPERHLRLKEVLAATGWSRSTLYDRIRAGRFPAQIEAEGNIASWKDSEVQEWLRNPR